MKSTRSLLQVASLTLLTAGSVPAAVFVTNPVGAWDSSGSEVSIGTVFNVGSTPVSIKALGLFDKDGDGLEQAEEVGIYALGQVPTLLGSVTIQKDQGSVFHDGTRWENLAKVIDLQANTTYVLAWSLHSRTVPVTVTNPTGFTLNPLFTLDGLGYAYSETGIPGLNFPNLDQRAVGHFAFGGNMELVPEPSAGLVVGAGLLGIAAWRRGRNRVAAK